ncbi:MAG: hypothetical protein HOZ81_42955 [Streptomyces sp.]|nr:hypothetical protein [Streptomyces sp.]
MRGIRLLIALAACAVLLPAAPAAQAATAAAAVTSDEVPYVAISVEGVIAHDTEEESVDEVSVHIKALKAPFLWATKKVWPDPDWGAKEEDFPLRRLGCAWTVHEYICPREQTILVYGGPSKDMIVPADGRKVRAVIMEDDLSGDDVLMDETFTVNPVSPYEIRTFEKKTEGWHYVLHLRISPYACSPCPM